MDMSLSKLQELAMDREAWRLFASGHLKILFCREAILGSKLPRWLSDKEPACQLRECRRCGFDPWVREDPLKKEMATHSSTVA